MEASNPGLDDNQFISTSKVILNPAVLCGSAHQKKNPGFAWEHWSSVQAVYSADGTAEQTMKLRSSYLCHMWFVLRVSIPHETHKQNTSQCFPSATTGPTDTSGTCSGGRTRQLRFAEHSARTRAPMPCLLWRFSSKENSSNHDAASKRMLLHPLKISWYYLQL